MVVENKISYFLINFICSRGYYVFVVNYSENVVYVSLIYIIYLYHFLSTNALKRVNNNIRDQKEERN